MKRWTRLAAVLAVCGMLGLPAEVRAFDPMTMSSAAPQALELATLWSPHAINAMQSGGLGFVNVGQAMLNILKLPLGLLQCTLGYPFGMAESGVNNCVGGVAAPFELVYHTLLLPVRILSLGAVR
ncbi:MAG: hypothetical protein MR051_04290 [Lentisphaeria bacterium]|nr:hypothetical protein [Lentisphaeria bacterium]